MNKTFYNVKTKKRMWEISTWGTVATIAWWFGLAAVFEYFQVSEETLIVLSVMLALDYIFGVVDAYITDKESVTSTKMWQWLVKKLTRWMLPLVVIAVLRWVWVWDLEYISMVIFSILIITEGYSIIWHFYSINAGKQIPEIDCFEMLLNFIINLFKWHLPNIETKNVAKTKWKWKWKK